VIVHLRYETSSSNATNSTTDAMEDEAQGYGNGEGKGGSRRATAGGGTAAAAGGSASPSAAAATTAPAASKPTRTHGERWEESFRRLVAFQKKHGHCNIPYRYEEDPFLGRWVSLQRSIYKGEAAAASSAGSSAAAAAAPSASALAQGDTATQRDRIRRLNEIGFEWNPQETRHVSWEQRYGELCDFVARNGHARVPLGWKVRNGKCVCVCARARVCVWANSRYHLLDRAIATPTGEHSAFALGVGSGTFCIVPG
jgi:Helicase associated domain